MNASPFRSADIWRGKQQLVQEPSHPTAGVAGFGPKASDRLSSLSEEPAEIFTRIFVLGLEHGSAGRVVHTDFFEVLYRVRY